MSTKMKVLTLWEPYATLIALGLKQWETRPHTIRWQGHRGLIAIHAGLSMEGFRDDLPAYVLKALADHGFVHPEDYPRGHIVAVANMAAVRFLSKQTMPSISDFERAVGGWTPQRLAIQLKNVQRLAVPLKVERGFQGLWGFNDALIEAALKGQNAE